MKRPCGLLAGSLGTFVQHVVDPFDALLVVAAAFADRVERLVEHGDQKFLDLHVAQTAAAVVRLQLVERRVVGEVGGEMLGAAEGVEVGEDGVALDLARVLHAQVVGIGVHAHHLLSYLLGRIAQVDAVAQRLGHLGLAVGAGQAHAGCVLGQQDFRLDERGAVDRVELVDDLARLFEHRLLILAGGDGRGAESGDVRRLRNGVGEEPDGNALPLQVVLRVVLREAAQLDFGLHGRVALQTGHGDEVHVVERQFAQFGDLRLDEERRPFGVEAAGQVVERHLDDVLAHLFGVVGVVGERLRVGDHDEDLLELSGVLQLHAAAQRTYIVAEVQFAGRPVSGQDDFSHNSVCRFCISGFCRVDRPDRGMNFFGF